MKKTILLMIAILLGFSSIAQTDNGFNYKALITNNGSPVANHNVVLKFTIKRNGTTIWSEYTNVTTDANGIASAVIGEGTPYSGYSNFENLDWGSENTTLSVDVSLGSGFNSLVVDEPFKYVPYAKSAEMVTGVQKKLGVGESPNSMELVRFFRHNIDYAEDVLDLEMSGTSTDDAQFIECNIGLNTQFRVDGDGSVFVKKVVRDYTDKYDMLPLAWGTVQSDGTIKSGSGNFSVNKTATGVYEISITGVSTLPDTEASVIANPGYSAVDVYIRSYIENNKVFVKTRHAGNNANRQFNFIIFKQ
jgi:hypothetical protein